MAKYNVCTNFYSNYLYKGLALYYSLEKTSKDFLLWILCMDEEAYKDLSKLKLKHARLIQLDNVETPDLLKIKAGRDKSEYSWTLKSSLMSYLFKKYPKIPSLFYLDGDMFFFKDIKLVYGDIGDRSIAIAPHRFPEKLKARTSVSGIFNAGVVYIKKDAIGLKALERWRTQCINWCYRIPEGKKFGDQMYLDEWPKLYKNLHQFQHRGINLAPWNIRVHKIYKDKGVVYVGGQPLIFYHFHELKIYSDLTFSPSYGYNIPKKTLQLIYKHYEDTIIDIIKKLDRINPNLKSSLEKKNFIKDNVQKIKRILLPIYWGIRSF